MNQMNPITCFEADPMSCIYTGAYVLFSDYNAYVRADLFSCGNQILIQWEPASWQWAHEIEGEPEMHTHLIRIGFGYHHEKRGITVTHESNVQGERR